MLQGNIVSLRALEREDLKLLLPWRNKSSMRRFYREYRELNMADQEAWYTSICCNNRNFCMFGIIYNPQSVQPVRLDHATPQPSELIGVCGLTNINWVLRTAELSFYIGYNDLYCDDEYAQDTVLVLMNYGFNILNMHKIWAEIYEVDTAKKRLFDKLEFHQDAILRDNAFDQGVYFNSLVYSVLDSEFVTSSGNSG